MNAFGRISLVTGAIDEFREQTESAAFHLSDDMSHDEVLKWMIDRFTREIGWRFTDTKQRPQAVWPIPPRA